MAAIQLIKGAGVARFSQSKLGGEPALGSEVLIPLDRSGTAMNFLLQLNFGELATEPRGILLVYVARDIEKAQAKDRKSYRFIWEAAGAPDVVQPTVDAGSPLVLASDTASSDGAECEIFPTTHPRMREAQLICAFSSNGISYSDARAKDDCYSHLVEQAPSYKLLFSLRTDTGTNFLSLIQQDDYTNRMLEKAWLLRF
ncbi:MAG TPA: DUF1963 domain-containing protein [Drouetiella sp.]